MEIEDWQYVINQFLNMCIGLLSRTAEEKREREFDNEIRNMAEACLRILVYLLYQ